MLPLLFIWNAAASGQGCAAKFYFLAIYTGILRGKW
jgi:hypothetical protein